MNYAIITISFAPNQNQYPPIFQLAHKNPQKLNRYLGVKDDDEVKYLKTVKAAHTATSGAPSSSTQNQETPTANRYKPQTKPGSKSTKTRCTKKDKKTGRKGCGKWTGGGAGNRRDDDDDDDIGHGKKNTNNNGGGLDAAFKIWRQRKRQNQGKKRNRRSTSQETEEQVKEAIASYWNGAKVDVIEKKKPGLKLVTETKDIHLSLTEILHKDPTKPCWYCWLTKFVDITYLFGGKIKVGRFSCFSPLGKVKKPSISNPSRAL